MTNISLGWSINNTITYFMRNYFRKYFLVLAFISLSPQPVQAIEIKFSWILGSIYTTVKSYLPTFSLFSFLAKHEFRKKNIQEQENTKKQKPLNPTAIKFAASFLVYEYVKKLNITLLKTIQKTQKYDFNLDFHLKTIEECIKQGANPVYLQNLFAKHPEYKKNMKIIKKRVHF